MLSRYLLGGCIIHTTYNYSRYLIIVKSMTRSTTDSDLPARFKFYELPAEDIEYALRDARYELARAEEELMLADTPREKDIAGARCDALEDYISDLLVGP